MTTNTKLLTRRSAGWVGYAAAGWAALYATVALIWTVTGDGFPFGKADPDSMSVLRNLPAEVGAPALAGLLVATCVAALAMTGAGPVSRPYRIGLLTFGWLVAGLLLVVLPDARVLALAGYAPVLLVGAPFGWPDIDYAEVFTSPLLNQLFSILGGFLLVATVRAWQRRTGGACARCGRGDAPVSWTTRAAAARWGQWAVYLAVAVPLCYAVSRYAWLLGFPLGVTDEFLDDLHADGAASVVSALVTSAGLGLVSDPRMYDFPGGDVWALLPQLLWPLWSTALAAATFAYYLRRRGACAHCGRS